MKIRLFAARTSREILRDPLNICFGLGFPVIILLLLYTIQRNVPVELFALQNLTPGIMVFGYSFLTLFSATLIARDRESAFLSRLFTTPLTATDFIFGYTLPLIPMAMGQSALCLLLSMALGLAPTLSMLTVLVVLLPTALFFISLGLICGSIFNVKQVGGLCGALLTNLCAWLSGAWFDLALVGGALEAVAGLLPFAHAVTLARAALAGALSGAVTDLIWVCGYAAVALIAAVLVFLRKMRRK